MILNVDAIPLELRERPQWVLWRTEERDGKPTKVPYRVDGRGRASSTDAATWATFEASIAAASEADGIGYVFSPDDPYVGLDLDGGLSEADRAAIVLARGHGRWLRTLVHGGHSRHRSDGPPGHTVGSGTVVEADRHSLPALGVRTRGAT